MFEIEFTENAFDDLLYFTKAVQNLILDTVEQQLIYQPSTVTRNRKLLRPNPISAWELRIEVYRVFYDINVEESKVIIKAVGYKEHNTLFIRGKEFEL